MGRQPPRFGLPLPLVTPPDTPPATMAPWEEVSFRKKADREALLAARPEWRIPPPSEDVLDVSSLIISHLTPRELGIVQVDATELLQQLSTSQVSAVEVVTAYCKVATAAQDLTNCLTEICFDDALARAAELDQHLKETGTVVGPLHGLPVSIKDHILVKGLDTATGYIGWAYKTFAQKDAVAVDILRKAGAIIYVKTANPQTLLCLETNNNIYGPTLNPFNRKLSSGGSSGGESALIAAYGSPLGIGTDIGGSIREPAAVTGLYGFKASVARMPHAGLMGSHDGMDNIVGVLGPLARSARDLELFCRVMLQSEAWLLEHAILEIPWRTDVVKGLTLPQKLTFAILWDDGVVRPHPPILASLQRTKEALLEAGHEVIDWTPLDHMASWDLICKLYLLDGGREYVETLEESGEPPVPGTDWMLAHANGRKPYTVEQIFRLNLEREAFRAKVLTHWNATKERTSTGRPVDGIIAPAFATLAPPHNTTRWWGYTSYWNLVDYPGVVFPTGKLSPGDFDIPKEELPAARNDIEAFIRNQWSPQTYMNAPIGLQLVGRRLNEEKVLAMLNVVEDSLKSHATR